MQIGIWYLFVPAGCVGGGLNTGTLAAFPPAITWKLLNSVSLECIWCLSRRCPFAGPQGEYLYESESVCGPFKRTPGFPAALCLRETNSLLPFTVRYHGDPSSWHWSSWLGCLVWGWDLSLKRGTLQLRCPSWFSTITRVWDQLVLSLYTSYWSRCGFFFTFLVIVLFG